MANQCYITITGKVQGLISAGCSVQDSNDTRGMETHPDEILLLSYTHNLAHFSDTDKAGHCPIYISKYVDRSSPLLAQAMSNHEELNGRILFYRQTTLGQLEQYYSVEFTGGLLVDFGSDFAHSDEQNNGGPQEHLAIRYREVFWTHFASDTRGSSTWNE